MTKVLDINQSKIIERNKNTSSIAMMVVLISFSMLFLTLMMSYLVYRLNNTIWPPVGFSQIPLIIPTISTAIIALSSLSFYKFEQAYQNENLLKAKIWFYITLVFGSCFLVSQLFLWKQLNVWGLYVESGIFASILHGFTWIHAAHVVLGILALLFLVPTAHKKSVYPVSLLKINNIGKFWHFLGIVWLVMFIILFVL